ncbi:MAG: ABC transporter permease [Chloroflexota bacterium]
MQKVTVTLPSHIGTADLPSQSAASPFAAAVRRFILRRTAVVGVLLVVALTLLAIMANVVAPHDPLTTNLARPRSAPTAEFLLGADSVGRDVFSRLLHGARASLTVGFATVALNVVLGLLIGSIAGYYGRVWDQVLMRATDVVQAFPLFIVAVSVVAVLSPSLLNVVLVLGLLGWPTVARLVRGNILSVRTYAYVDAARSLGATDGRILRRHVLPNVLAPIIVAATFGVARAILLETSLSFLGLGVQPPTPSWGNMLAEAQSLTTLESMPYLWVPPGLAIAVLVAAVNLVGDGLHDAVDPGRRHRGSIA